MFANTTETETLAREFDAVLSVQRRFGLSTLYRLTRKENGATIAVPCQSENALEGACRLLNVVLRQKKNARRLVWGAGRLYWIAIRKTNIGRAAHLFVFSCVIGWPARFILSETSTRSSCAALASAVQFRPWPLLIRRISFR